MSGLVFIPNYNMSCFLGSVLASVYYGNDNILGSRISISPQLQDNPISQAQTEVQSMLKIIENQTHACKNMSALNNLRRQLTELCGQFSVYLAGGQSADFVTPPTKRSRT